MKRIFLTAGIVIVLAATGVACDKIRPPQPELQKPPATSGQASQQEGERNAFAQAAQKELDDLRSVIAEFRTKTEAANVEAKARLGEELAKLETELRDTQQRLTELKSATLGSWNQMKESFGNSLERLKGGVVNFRKNAT